MVGLPRNLLKTAALNVLVVLGLVGCADRENQNASETNSTATPKQIDSVTQSEASEHHYFHNEENSHAAEWGYTGNTGPEKWGELSPDYVLAKTGKRQSPIDITNPKTQQLAALKFKYHPAKIDLVYNGHTVQETEETGSWFEFDDQRFSLKQFHFHAPSEHTIGGQHADMEMHLVHKNAKRAVAVVAVLIKQGDENSAFDQVWDYLPTKVNKERKSGTTIDAATLLPKDRNYFRYMGSFTTPPCTEDVSWFVLTKPIQLSAGQIDRFKSIISGNNRPTQPLNDRTVSLRKE